MRVSMGTSGDGVENVTRHNTVNIKKEKIVATYVSLL
jgi:hypothetical protein